MIMISSSFVLFLAEVALNQDPLSFKAVTPPAYSFLGNYLETLTMHNYRRLTLPPCRPLSDIIITYILSNYFEGANLACVPITSI